MLYCENDQTKKFKMNKLCGKWVGFSRTALDSILGFEASMFRGLFLHNLKAQWRNCKPIPRYILVMARSTYLDAEFEARNPGADVIKN